LSRVYVEAFKCDRCGHVWLPRDMSKSPSSCAKCKSGAWDAAKKESPSVLPGRNDSTPEGLELVPKKALKPEPNPEVKPWQPEPRLGELAKSVVSKMGPNRKQTPEPKAEVKPEVVAEPKPARRKKSLEEELVSLKSAPSVAHVHEFKQGSKGQSGNLIKECSCGKRKI